MEKYGYILFVVLMTSLHCNAQQQLFSYYGNVEPRSISFMDRDEGDELFQCYLSSFDIREKSKEATIYIGMFNDQNKKELDSAYWRYAIVNPGFKTFPAFVLDCKDGYLVGLHVAYRSYRSYVYNLDIMSYDKKGKIKEKMSFPIFHTGFFSTEDSCLIAYQILGGVLTIEKGKAIFEYDSSRCCTPEVAKCELYADDVKDVWREKRKYVYEIGDNARLILVSVSDITNQ